MLAQCPGCRTVFAVNEQQLAVHHGLVRCGQCGDVFNASWNLVDQVPAGEEVVGTTGEQGQSALTDNPAEAVHGAPSGPTAESASAEPSAPEGGASDDGDAIPTAATSPADTPAPPAAGDAEQPGEQSAWNAVTAVDISTPVPLNADIEDGTVRAEQTTTAATSALPPGDGEGPAHPAETVTSPVATPVEPPVGGSPPDGPAAPASDPAAEEQTPRRQERQTDGADVRGKQATPFDLPGAEEIVIEAPPMLWNAFDEESAATTSPKPTERPEQLEFKIDERSKQPKKEGRSLADGLRRALGARADADSPQAGQATSRSTPRPARPGSAAVTTSGEWTRPTSEVTETRTPAHGTRKRIAQDVKLVEIPQPKPVKAMAWWLAGLLLLLAALWQLTAFYLDGMAQVPALRPLVVKFCNVVSCSVPPRRAFSLIDLVGTSVNTHPDAPGALRVSVNLINRAEFEQSYPPLEITLSDRSGRVVGRRTYLPDDYLERQQLLAPKIIQRVDLDLAQPSESAVGYEIQLVSR